MLGSTPVGRAHAPRVARPVQTGSRTSPSPPAPPVRIPERAGSGTCCSHRLSGLALRAAPSPALPTGSCPGRPASLPGASSALLPPPRSPRFSAASEPSPPPLPGPPPRLSPVLPAPLCGAPAGFCRPPLRILSPPQPDLLTLLSPLEARHLPCRRLILGRRRRPQRELHCPGRGREGATGLKGETPSRTPASAAPSPAARPPARKASCQGPQWARQAASQTAALSWVMGRVGPAAGVPELANTTPTPTQATFPDSSNFYLKPKGESPKTESPHSL